jgi:serine/threonine protein kinase/tetratricopeptide (TPR) repeat protein
MALAAGTSLGPYEITRLIGAGGMGEVYLAQDVRLRRQVALKRLIARSPDPPHSSDSLLNEARAAATLNHPNIAAVYDVFEAQGSAYIVMEYAPGETLAQVLQRGPLPAERVANIGLQLADALMAAHAGGILHRDLKPSNIHLTPAGHIKVLDFGIARIAADTRQSRDAPTHTATATVLAGTPGYISPEQLAGESPDQRSDLYAAGVILFQLATGRHPFEGAGLLDRMLLAVGRNPPRASDVHAGVPLPLSDVIARALSTRPAERYQSAAEFQSALESATAVMRSGRPSDVPTRPAKTWPVAGRLVPRRGWLVFTGVLAAAFVVMITVGMRWTWLSSPPPADARVPGRATVAVLPPQNRTGQRQIDGWPDLIQCLLASELTGVPDLAVMDVLAVNDLLDIGRASAPGERRPLDVLRRARVTLLLDGEVVSVGAGYQIGGRVIDPVTGESQFFTHVDVAKEEALPAAARELATQVLAFLQVQVLQVQDKDLRPWISYREQNIEAVKAFVLANQYVYRRQPAESEKYIRRAIELDPSFIAPKLWLIPRLIRQGKVQEANQIFSSLVALESKASPFEQSLIDYVGARLRRDVLAQVRAVETALVYSPGNNILLVILANLRLTAGDCTAARAAMAPAVEIGWRYPALYPLWAWCSAETAHSEDAARGIDRSLELVGTSDDPDTYGLLEAVAIAIGDSARAVTSRNLYERRKRETRREGTSPDVMFVYGRLGQSSMRLHRYKEAAALYRKAVAAEPAAAVYHDNLGSALEALGDEEGARTEYQTVIALDSGMSHARERLTALTKGARPKGDR